MLKSLEDHNNQRGFVHRSMDKNRPVPNGIACPECGAELYDSNPLFTLTSSPPKKHIHCSSCDYKGYRIA